MSNFLGKSNASPNLEWLSRFLCSPYIRHKTHAETSRVIALSMNIYDDNCEMKPLTSAKYPCSSAPHLSHILGKWLPVEMLAHVLLCVIRTRKTCIPLSNRRVRFKTLTHYRPLLAAPRYSHANEGMHSQRVDLQYWSDGYLPHT